MNRECAERINENVEKMIELANDILLVANSYEDDESRRNIRRVLANVVTDLDLDILEPIYKQFPDMRPPSMDAIR